MDTGQRLPFASKRSVISTSPTLVGGEKAVPNLTIGDAGTGGNDEKFHHPANQCVQAEQGNKAKGSS